MSVEELERQKETVQTTKAEPPRDWQVVMHDRSPNLSPCTFCILEKVFNLSAAQVRQHVRVAKENGKDTILSSTRDVAETKAREAEDMVRDKEKFCSPYIGINFTAEPS